VAEQYWLPQAAPVCVYVLFADDPIATQGGTSNDRPFFVKVDYCRRPPGGSNKEQNV